MIYLYMTLGSMAILSVADHLRNAENKFRNKTWINVLFFFVFIIFVVISGIRYGVGTDYTTYTVHQIPGALNHYRYTTGYKVEPLYRAIIYLGNFLGSNQWVFVFTHLIIMLFVLQYIKHQSEDYAFSIFVFVFGTFYAFSLNGMRQAIATSIFLFASQYISKRDYKRYFILIFVAFLFHKSALLYIPFYFLTKINLTASKRLLPVSVVIAFLAINSQTAYDILYNISKNYNLYFKFFNSRFNVGTQFNTMYIGMLLLNYLIVFIYYYFNDGAVENRSEMNVAFNIQLIGLIFSSVAFSIPGAFRVFYFFIPVQICLVPNMIKSINDITVRRVIKVSFVVIYIVMFIYLIVIQRQNGVLPYRTIFQQLSF